MVTYAVTTAPEDFSLKGLASAGAGGSVSGSLGGLSGSASGVSNTLIQGSVQYGLSGEGNVADGIVDGMKTGEAYSASEGLVDLAAGSALSHIPSLADLGSPNAGQGAHFAATFAEQRLAWGVDVGKVALESQNIIQ